MCMTVIDFHRTGVTVAVDRRISAHRDTGEFVGFEDVGGRLLRFGRAWVVGAGNAPHVWAVLKELSRLDCGNVPDVEAAIRRVAASVDDAVASLIPRQNTFFSTIPDQPACAVNYQWNGSSQLMTWGAAYPTSIAREATAVLESALFADMGGCKTHFDRVRRIAREFATIAERSPTVSPTIEIAIGHRYWCGPSARMAQMGNSHIAASLGRPPQPGFDKTADSIGRLSRCA